MENGPKSEIMLKFKSNWFVKRESKERKVVIESILWCGIYLKVIS